MKDDVAIGEHDGITIMTIASLIIAAIMHGILSTSYWREFFTLVRLHMPFDEPVYNLWFVVLLAAALSALVTAMVLLAIAVFLIHKKKRATAVLVTIAALLWVLNLLPFFIYHLYFGVSWRYLSAIDVSMIICTLFVIWMAGRAIDSPTVTSSQENRESSQ